VKALLVLADGRVFSGKGFGAEGEVSGEVVFNTGMAGYQEVLTDPSYYGQIINMTYPLIGNYGVNPQDMESDKIQVRGFSVRELCRFPSNFRSQQTLESWFKSQNIIGIEGLDTRALTRHIRQAGSMNGVLSTQDESVDSLRKKAQSAPSMAGLDLVKYVTCKMAYDFIPEGPVPPARLKVVVIDCGAKTNISRELASRGCSVRVVPATATAREIMAVKPDGVMISNGPGDPAVVTYVIATVKELMGQVPMFGICLGQQIMGLAYGARTIKLKFGHRGVNHPVKELATGRVGITSQNHGFSVDAASLPADVEVTHINMNDQTPEGLRHKKFPMFSVQYHPEASPGPNDAKELFDRFIELMKKENH
jgi:carbamoyl-phosphate synthase small subunit